MKNKLNWRFQEKLNLLLVDALFYCAITALLFGLLVVGTPVSVLPKSPGFWFILLNLLGWNYVFGNYEIEVEKNQKRTLKKSILVLLMTLVFVIIVNYLIGKDRAGVFGRGVLGGSLTMFLVYLQATRWWLARIWRSVHQNFRWLFIADDNTKQLIQKDCEISRLPFPIDWRVTASEQDLVGDSDSLLGVVFSIKERRADLIDALMGARLRGLAVLDLIDFYETYFYKIPVFYLSSDFFSFSKGFTLLANSLLQRLKRLSDIIIATFVLIPGLPLMAFTAFGVRLGGPGPVIFRQQRTGKDGRTFTLYKFRSMRTDAEASGAQWAKVNDSRVTNFGKFIRKTRLDELPQLWNILKGDMSFVGPRPERPEFNRELEKDIPFYQLRHLVRPGLTGWAQVHYPYGASKEDAFQKLQFDLYYVKNFTLILDLQIILKTIRVVVLGQGR
jgi:exopolysaccharide biosynthesis polyprenyl glycosylphosphotransferase